MKYLFFDIECANSFGGTCKMCEFGYVLTDNNFNVIQKVDYPMSPGKKSKRDNRFDLKIYDREPGFKWAYDTDFYYTCEEFPFFYERIKGLLEDEDTLVFGHAVANDLRYLNSAAKRYNLPTLDFSAYDTQVMMNYFSTQRQNFLGLKDAFLRLCSHEEYIKIQSHLSADDAYMTMRVVQRMCEELEVSLTELIGLCEGSKINFKDVLYRKSKMASHKKVETKDANERKDGQVLWGDFYRLYRDVFRDESAIGRRVTVSGVLKEDVVVLEQIINMIKLKDLIAFDGLRKADILIVKDEEDKARLLNILQEPFKGSIVFVDDFINIKGIE